MHVWRWSSNPSHRQAAARVALGCAVGGGEAPFGIWGAQVSLRAPGGARRSRAEVEAALRRGSRRADGLDAVREALGGEPSWMPSALPCVRYQPSITRIITACTASVRSWWYARGTLIWNGKLSTISVMRRPMQRGQKPRPLHESPASRSSPQWSINCVPASAGRCRPPATPAPAGVRLPDATEASGPPA